MPANKKILSVVGARPNFVKIAALEKAFRAYPQAHFQIVHTGQHYDPSLDEVFFRQLDIPAPDYHLSVGSGQHSRQLGQMLTGLEPVLAQERPDIVLVVGDTVSALAGALAASGASIPVAHVEAGLRSGDRSMPEEINRILTDTLSDYLFVTEQAGVDNLQKQFFGNKRSSGVNIIPKIYLTGNCMIDTLVAFQEQANRTGTIGRYGLVPRQYALVTLHRPSNVDTVSGLQTVITILETLCQDIQVVFPLHPRTAKNLQQYDLQSRLEAIPRLQITAPQGYLEFLNLLEHAALAVTDSGGIQDETTYLGVPCLTLRTTTERPVTVQTGTNELVPSLDPGIIRRKVRQILSGQWKKGGVPEMWDGQSSRRIAEILINISPRNH